MTTYHERFSDADLDQIIEEGLIYMCACPAQVAEAVRKIRSLYRYQLNCLENVNNDSLVHRTIAHSAMLTHAQLEECMEAILALEKWDRSTLQMPANLRQRQAEELNSDSRYLESPTDRG